MRVLIVEDEPALAESIARGLRAHGMAVDLAFDGAAGLDKAGDNPYDVIVLDRDLPVLHGDEVCARLVEAANPSRILMLTAASEVDDLVAGFALGADDYLGKPFAFAELVARITALARRPQPGSGGALSHGDLTLDPALLTVARGGSPVRLTSREFAVLEILLRAQGRVVSSEELLERAWDEHADPFTSSVRVMVSRLRTKLGEPALIRTVVGRGYQL